VANQAPGFVQPGCIPWGKGEGKKKPNKKPKAKPTPLVRLPQAAAHHKLPGLARRQLPVLTQSFPFASKLWIRLLKIKAWRFAGIGGGGKAAS